MISDGYMSGLFDGEGTILLYPVPNGYSLQVKLGMTNLAVVQAIKEKYGGTITFQSSEKARSLGRPHADVYKWDHRGSHLSFLRSIVGELIEKKDQVELAIRYIEEFGEGRIGGAGRHRTDAQKQRQEWYMQEFKRMKSRGKSFVVVV